MSLQVLKPNALSQLHDIHLPEPISWWPLASSWWLLLLLSCLFAVTCWYVWRWFQLRNLEITQKKILAAAMTELNRVDASFKTNELSALVNLSALMRRIAVQLDGGATGLVGNAWLQWLDSRWQQDDFTTGAGRSLADAPYRPVSEADAKALCRVCRHWLEAQGQ